MTKTKTILAISLAGIFVLSGVLIPAYAAGHLAIDKTEVKLKTDFTKTPIKQTFDVKIKASATIPSSGLFGYGILSSGLDNVVALTSHGGVFDHPFQSSPADPVAHAHVLDLAPAGSLGDTCDTIAGVDLVVDFAKSDATGNNIGAPYDVKVKNKDIKVKKIPVGPADMLDDSIEAIVAFAIVPDGTLDPSTALLGTVPSPLPFLCLDLKP